MTKKVDAAGPLDRGVMPHTSGPWMVVNADRGYIITALDGCYDVAVVRNIGNQNNQANATLLAAAPELLSALEYVALEHLTPHGAKVVRAAIAMARGHEA